MECWTTAAPANLVAGLRALPVARWVAEGREAVQPAAEVLLAALVAVGSTGGTEALQVGGAAVAGARAVAAAEAAKVRAAADTVAAATADTVADAAACEAAVVAAVSAAVAKAAAATVATVTAAERVVVEAAALGAVVSTHRLVPGVAAAAGQAEAAWVQA